jgi:hypothetical protein
MRQEKQTGISCDEWISEIATILARGYLHYRKGRRLKVEAEGDRASPDLSK